MAAESDKPGLTLKEQIKTYSDQLIRLRDMLDAAFASRRVLVGNCCS
jgi:hypothetical protein